MALRNFCLIGSQHTPAKTVGPSGRGVRTATNVHESMTVRKSIKNKLQNGYDSR